VLRWLPETNELYEESFAKASAEREDA